ncbi:T9SS type A sorting domain-containing protein [Flaviaesturariibacter flavus]|uniref:T9SS type A sorting domain-containing protein n=1 Tax=Flaviaesturariibacter flavus TaxID=2502780 RepID=A0A4R1BMS9_9BACT|nr:T9SS type A sorting domain-containing protein [Flaviaesturariibacter flavus]TCJ18773.1 T9SS type A sorting domain-containing protein [Flaviaesturariibacter flavus]
MRLNALFFTLCLLVLGSSAFAQTQQSSYGFLSLSGRDEKNNAVITWETIQELTITDFNIQQSTDGHRFETIGTISANYDTLAIRHQYRFVDAQAAADGKLVYYRLQININNGRTLYSKILMVRFDEELEEKLSFYPNTVSTSLPLALATRYEGGARLQIVDAYGRIQQSEALQVTPGNTFRSIDVSRLPRGQYFAVVLGDGLRLQQRFFRQ